MKTLRKCIYLILGLLVVGFSSCANSSGGDDNLPQIIEALDRDKQSYRDGFYKYSDGTTTLYLYYENKELKAAGNRENRYEYTQIDTLKQSHSWKNVHQYCSRYEVSLSDGWMCNVGKIPLNFFKKGWWSFEKTAYLGGSIIVYYESHNEYPAYQVLKKGDTFYRAPPTSYSYWISSVSLKDSNPAFISEELDYYPELSSMFKKGWWKITSWASDYFYYFENLTDAPSWKAHAMGDSDKIYRFANENDYSDNWIITFRKESVAFISEDLNHYPEKTGISE